MKRVGIHIHANLGSTWRGRLLGVVLACIVLSIFLLLMLGIWVVLAVVATVAILIGLARAFFPTVSTDTSRLANTPSLEMHGNSCSSDDDSHDAQRATRSEDVG